MPWMERSRMSLRVEFIEELNKGILSMSELCRRYEISRKTGYKWWNRYLLEGAPALSDQSRRPLKSPHQINSDLSNQVCAIREQHPTWGGRKIRVILLKQGIQNPPAASTISGILRRRGYIKEGERDVSPCNRFEHEAPNHLWQMDFKGHFAYEQGRCYPLTVIDDHSRFNVALVGCLNEQRVTVKTQLISIFQRYGLPKRINVDNGNPWGSLFDCARYTKLSVWLLKLGIDVSYSRPRHPQTNGKCERFHRTLKSELLQSTYFKSLSDIQKAFDQWRHIYNWERPHEGIGMSTPSDRYHMSYRPYQEASEEYDYAEDYIVKKADCRGRLHLNSRQVFIGMPFSGENIGIRESLQNKQFEIYFRHQLLGSIDLNLLEKGTHLNLYSGRITRV